MLKRAQEKKSYIHRDSVKDEIEAARQEGLEKNKKIMDYYEKQYVELLNTTDIFRDKTGIDLSAYHWRTNPEKLGAVVKFINDGGSNEIKKELTELEETAKDIVTKISTQIQNLKSLTEEPK